MLTSDKISLHYQSIGNTAHKIEKASKDLSSLYKDSYFNADMAKLRKEQLKKYVNKLKKLLDK